MCWLIFSRWIGALYFNRIEMLHARCCGHGVGASWVHRRNVKSAPKDAFVALASQHGYFLHPLETFMFAPNKRWFKSFEKWYVKMHKKLRNSMWSFPKRKAKIARPRLEVIEINWSHNTKPFERPLTNTGDIDMNDIHATGDGNVFLIF